MKYLLAALALIATPAAAQTYGPVDTDQRAKVFSKVSVFVQGGVVAANLRFAF